MKRKSIMTDDWEHCFLCGREAQQIHHVFNKHDKKRSEKFGLLVPLCMECHLKVHDEPSQETNRELKQLGQTYFEREYGEQYWWDEFGRSYL